MILFLSYFI